MPQWSARQIHDTVAAIARQPAYGGGERSSLLGRVLRYIADRVADFVRLLEGSGSARAVVIVAVLAIVGVVIARIVVDRRMAEARRVRGGGRSLSGERRDFWASADQLAARNDFAGALHELHAAVIDELARAGTIKWHASKTNGDYARELRRRGAVQAEPFRSFAIDIDRVMFGAREVAQQDYARLRAAAERVFARRIAA